ncbi:hypothetical protein AMTR_s00074p00191810 [Amborella trichopoda]|uniref:Uncharacterized protein n=1 Tax=Amborella trichopoda TaxID=13333 RepID=W1NN19_AMBTC|nr:hypothetical protein AMTR_s00074p00191810 [Amborella trichopoda]
MAVTSSSSSSSSLKLPSLSPLLTSKTLTWLPQLLPHRQQRPYLSLVMTSPSPQQIFRTHASKSSSTSFLAFDQIKEDVPAGVEVTETKEPGSRVRLLSFSLFAVIAFYYVRSFVLSIFLWLF